MFSIMRAHQERTRNEGRVVAELPAPKAATPAAPAGKGLLAGKQLEDFLTASLTEDLAALKGITSVERKAEHKRAALLPKYAPYVKRLKEPGCRHELLGYWLVWLFDAGNIDEAAEHADWCLEHGIGLPERFQSDIRFFIASQLIAWAEAEFNAGRAVDPYFTEWFGRIEDAPAEWNLPDELTARFYRLHGLRMEKDGALSAAEAALQRAFDLGAKVKTALERVQKTIARMNEDAPAGGDSPVEASPNE